MKKGFTEYMSTVTAHLNLLFVMLTVAIAQTACSTIDDDLSDCGTDYEMNYEMRLVTNMTTELQTQLNTTTEASVAKALENHLKTIFSDMADDVELSFYDTAGDSARLHYESHVMNNNQSSYTLYLPMRKYMHVALANIQKNNVVTVENDDRCHHYRLQQTKKDTVDSHTTGLFTARQPINVLEGVDQTFNVRLYMVNCANVLVVDPRGHSTDGLKIFTSGFATTYNPADSIYIFDKVSPVVRPTLITAPGSSKLSYCSVTFPSQEAASTAAPTRCMDVATRTVIETEEPFKTTPGTASLWHYMAYMKQPDGSITATKLDIRQPLRAGQLKIIKAYINDDGSLQTDDVSVGVSVKLNWNEGWNGDIDL